MCRKSSPAHHALSTHQHFRALESSGPCYLLSSLLQGTVQRNGKIGVYSYKHRASSCISPFTILSDLCACTMPGGDFECDKWVYSTIAGLSTVRPHRICCVQCRLPSQAAWLSGKVCTVQTRHELQLHLQRKHLPVPTSTGGPACIANAKYVSKRQHYAFFSCVCAFGLRWPRRLLHIGWPISTLV
jgi:hypothetical protein